MRILPIRSGPLSAGGWRRGRGRSRPPSTARDTGSCPRRGRTGRRTPQRRACRSLRLARRAEMRRIRPRRGVKMAIQISLWYSQMMAWRRSPDLILPLTYRRREQFQNRMASVSVMPCFRQLSADFSGSNSNSIGISADCSHVSVDACVASPVGEPRFARRRVQERQEVMDMRFRSSARIAPPSQGAMTHGGDAAISWNSMSLPALTEAPSGSVKISGDQCSPTALSRLAVLRVRRPAAGRRGAAVRRRGGRRGPSRRRR